MRYYWFNIKELLKKAKYKYHNSGSKEKAAECYFANEEVSKEKSRNEYRNLSGEEKEAKREYGEIGIET